MHAGKQVLCLFQGGEGVRETAFPFLYVELHYFRSIKQKFRAVDFTVRKQEKQRKQEPESCNSWMRTDS